MTARFAGQVAFVTGGSSGIGRATALPSPRGCGRRRHPQDDVRAALDRTVGAFGRLDLAFNYAGVEQSLTPLAELTAEE